MANNVTLLQLRMRSLRRANLENSPNFVDPTTEGNDYVNEGVKYLRDGLIAERHGHYFMNSTPATWTTTKDVQTIALPGDFHALEGLDLFVLGRWYPIEPSAFGDRHRYGQSVPFEWSALRPLPNGRLPIRYTIVGDTIFFQDPPTAAYNGRTWYVQSFVPLAADGDLINLWGFENIAILWAAKMMLQKEGSDVTAILNELADDWKRVMRIAKRRNATSGETRDATGLAFGYRWW